MVKADRYTFAWVLSSGHRQTDLGFLFLRSRVNIRCRARRSKLSESYDKLKYRSMTVNLYLKHPIPIFVDCHACVYWNNVCVCNHKKQIPAIIESFKLLFSNHCYQYWNSLGPSDACMRRQPRPSLFQIMACCLFSARPLSVPMLAYHRLDLWEQTLVKFYYSAYNIVMLHKTYKYKILLSENTPIWDSYYLEYITGNDSGQLRETGSCWIHMAYANKAFQSVIPSQITGNSTKG